MEYFALVNTSNTSFATEKLNHIVTLYLREENITSDLFFTYNVMKDLLRLHNVSYAVRDQQIVRDVSLSLGEGQIMSLIGYNGSGKSTLLKLML